MLHHILFKYVFRKAVSLKRVIVVEHMSCSVSLINQICHLLNKDAFPGCKRASVCPVISQLLWKTIFQQIIIFHEEMLIWWKQTSPGLFYMQKIRCKGLCSKLCSVKSEHTKRNLPSVEKGGRKQLGFFNGRDFSAPPAHGQRIEVPLVWQVWGSVNQTWTCKEICFSGSFALAVTCTTTPHVISIQESWLE